MGPLRLITGGIYKAFRTFYKGDLLGWKCLVKVSFDSPFLNLKGPISNTLKLLNVKFCEVIYLKYQSVTLIESDCLVVCVFGSQQFLPVQPNL